MSKMVKIEDMTILEKRIFDMADDVSFLNERLNNLTASIVDDDICADGIDELMDKVKKKLKNYSANKVRKITIEAGLIEIISFEEVEK